MHVQISTALERWPTKQVVALLLPVATLLTLVHAAFSQTSLGSDPVGLTRTQLLGNSDTLVSIPFTRPAEFTGLIQSVSGNVITVAGTTGWTANQFVYAAGVQPKHYYVLIGPSVAKEGHTYAVTANGTNTLTVDTTSDDLSGISANIQLVIIPNWTLGTIFPAADQNISFTATTATRTIKTDILIPNYSAVGTNQAFSNNIYFFSNNVNGTTNNIGWRIFGDNTTPHDDDPLIPDGYFVVRNSNGAPTLPLTALGSVLTKKLAVGLITQGNQAQDNSVSMIRPIAVSLNNTGLNPADGSFVATTSTRAFKDELLLFDNSVVSFNKSPTKIYFYGNSVNGDSNNGVGWRVFGDNATDRGPDQIPPGSAIIIRKAANGTANSATTFWVNAPTY